MISVERAGLTRVNNQAEPAFDIKYIGLANTQTEKKLLRKLLKLNMLHYIFQLCAPFIT